MMRGKNAAPQDAPRHRTQEAGRHIVKKDYRVYLQNMFTFKPRIKYARQCPSYNPCR